VDGREPKEMILILRKIGCDVITQTLDVSDYILSENLAVERKKGGDFSGSLVDNRLFEQLERLKDTFKSCILIIEDFEKMFERPKMKVSSLYGAMNSIAIRLKIPIIPTRNLQDTAICLKRLAIREQINQEGHALARHAPKEMSLEERKCFILEGLFDTGPKIARILVDKFKTPYNLFKAIEKSELTYTKNGNPKGINGPLDTVKGIGFKWLEKNKKLFS